MREGGRTAGPWPCGKRKQKKLEEEAVRGEQGRFAPGLPQISDRNLSKWIGSIL